MTFILPIVFLVQDRPIDQKSHAQDRPFDQKNKYQIDTVITIETDEKIHSISFP